MGGADRVATSLWEACQDDNGEGTCTCNGVKGEDVHSIVSFQSVYPRSISKTPVPHITSTSNQRTPLAPDLQRTLHKLHRLRRHLLSYLLRLRCHACQINFTGYQLVSLHRVRYFDRLFGVHRAR